MKTDGTIRIYYNTSLALGIASLVLVFTAVIWLIFTIPDRALYVLSITGLIAAGCALFFSLKALRVFRIFADDRGKPRALAGLTCGLLGAMGSLFFLFILIISH